MQAEKVLRQSEERYRTLAKKLRRANERKTIFSPAFPMVRNPLASIHNSLYILKQAKLGGNRVGRMIDILERQVGQLTRLVDDLLDITRITQKKIQLQRERLELNKLVRQTLDDHQSFFAKNGVHLEAEFAPMDLFLNADRARLVQVIGNLLQNAPSLLNVAG